MKKKNHAQFLIDVKRVRGDQFECLTPYVSSSKEITVRCKKCDTVFKTTPHVLLFALSKNACAVCRLDDIIGIDITHPKIAAEWHPTKNGEMIPSRVTSGSSISVWWRCPLVSDHEWKTSTSNRTRGGKCPFCNKCGGTRAIIPKSKSLAATYPHLASSWHPTKNGNLTPDTVTAGMHKAIYWICPKGHEYKANLGNRVYNNAGCPHCLKRIMMSSPPKNKRRMPLEEFIEKATKRHNGKYDYSKVIWSQSNHHHITIVCPIHGDFFQPPTHHLTDNECPKCSRLRGAEKRLVKMDEFVKRANLAHPEGQYDYSLVKYEHLERPVTIICRTHGKFFQSPTNHWAGKGCPLCANKKVAEMTRGTKETFIQEATQRHNGFYNYSQVIYNHCQEEVVIICPNHGTFKQQPTVHLRGCGCPLCANEEVGLKGRETQEHFLQRCHDAHGDRFDYSLAKYEKASVPVIIICKEHGQFVCTPEDHYSGKICPQCTPSRITPETPRNFYVLYVVDAENVEEYLTIGITVNNLPSRYVECGLCLREVCVIPSTSRYVTELEANIKRDFKKYRYEPVTDVPGFKTESFTLRSLYPLWYYIQEFWKRSDPSRLSFLSEFVIEFEPKPMPFRGASATV
jgi:hypothetical protein